MDNVEWLREFAEIHFDPDTIHHFISSADEIERLRGKLEKMQRSRDRYRQSWEAEKARVALKEGE